MTLTKEQKRQYLQQLATPPDFWGVINAEFQFQIDVCASKENAKCNRYIDSELGALWKHNPWLSPDRVVYMANIFGLGETKLTAAIDEGDEEITRAWCNPGFATVLPWHKKAYAEAQKHPGAVVVVIGLPGGSQDWWHFAHEHATEVRLLKDRVQYIPPPEIDKWSNTRESWLFIYRRKVVPCAAHIVVDDWRKRIGGGG